MGPQIDFLIVDTKFFANSFSMGFNCFVGNIQGSCNFFGRVSKPDKIGDFYLSGCQTIETGRKLAGKICCYFIQVQFDNVDQRLPGTIRGIIFYFLKVR